MSLIKKIAKKTLRKVYSIKPDYFPKNPLINILDDVLGHDISVKQQKPINSSGQEIPWFTYPAIEYLCQLDFSGKNIFEWGSGNSSLFFAKKATSIISIEINEEWFNIGMARKLENQTLILSSEKEYASKINEQNKSFDVIIIDGLVRYQCADLAPKHLNKGGMIIYDNSERDPEVCAQLRDKGFIQIDFFGFGPINYYSWTTSIFFKDFNFKPLTIQPVIPHGGIKEN